MLGWSEGLLPGGQTRIGFFTRGEQRIRPQSLGRREKGPTPSETRKKFPRVISGGKGTSTKVKAKRGNWVLDDWGGICFTHLYFLKSQGGGQG